MRTMLAVVSRSLKTVLQSRVGFRIAAILLALAALGFGAFMKDGAERSTPRGGALGRAAFRIGSTPRNLYRRFFGDPSARPAGSRQRFHGEAGLTFATVPPPRRGGKMEKQDIWSSRAIPHPRRMSLFQSWLK